MSAQPVLVIRADASPRMGTGHVMRCLALALAARDRGIPVHLVGRVAVDWVRSRLKMEGISFCELTDPVPVEESPEELLGQIGLNEKAAWVVLDGYHFGPACQKALRAAGYKLLLVDDYAHLPEYFCDILLNQNFGAEDLSYKDDIGQKLLGPKYALLRPEFSVKRGIASNRQFQEKARRILLTLGGGDFSEHMARIAPDFLLPQLEGCIVRVVAGAMPVERIRSLLRDCPAKVEILGRVDDMPALMRDTDLCVTAGGSTCWELCCLGVPFLTVEVAENQHGVIYGLHKNGIAPIYAPEMFASLMQDGAARQIRASAASTLVDGTGAERVILAMVGYSYISASKKLFTG